MPGVLERHGFRSASGAVATCTTPDHMQKAESVLNHSHLHNSQPYAEGRIGSQPLEQLIALA